MNEEITATFNQTWVISSEKMKRNLFVKGLIELKPTQSAPFCLSRMSATRAY